MHPTGKNFLASTSDANGTTLMSYVNTLMEKVDQALPQATITIIVANPIAGGDFGDIEVMSNVDRKGLGPALVVLGQTMQRNEKTTKPEVVN